MWAKQAVPRVQFPNSVSGYGCFHGLMVKRSSSKGKIVSSILTGSYYFGSSYYMCFVNQKYIYYFSYDAPTLHLQKISGFLTRRYAPLQKTLILFSDGRLVGKCPKNELEKTQ